MHTRRERGMVTAEAAAVLPVVVAFVMTLIWLVATVIAEIRVVDAARDAARAIARGDDESAAVGAAERTAPDGAEVDVSRSGDDVTVTVRVNARAPGWLLVPLPAIALSSDATVAVEDDD